MALGGAASPSRFCPRLALKTARGLIGDADKVNAL
jgi:hypothetical protein